MLEGPCPTEIGPPTRRPSVGSIRITELTCGIAAHTLPPPTATSWQKPGIGICLVRPVRGSTRTTLVEAAPATQTAPAPTATPRGPGPTVSFLRTLPVA